jgi:putative nucleotidyltransferase with HDIG domain
MNNHPPAGVFSYNRVIVALVAVMLTTLAVIDYTIIQQQRRGLMAQIHERAGEELAQAATFMTEPLLRYRFSDIELFIQQWSANNSEVVRFAALTPQGHTLTVFERPTDSPHLLVRERRIEFEGSHLLTLVLEKDYGPAEKILAQLRQRLVLTSLFISAALGLTLWLVFRYLAIRPLEQEVLRRRRAEAELVDANQLLEERVQERTREIAGLLEREKYLREIMQTVADINGLLITAPDLEALLGKACLRFVRHGHYRFCWIGLLGKEGLTAIYDSRPDQSVLAPGPYALAEGPNPFYHHPAAVSLRQNRTVTTPQADYPFSQPPWLEQGAIADFAQVVAIPLRSGGDQPPLGVLAVYTWRREGFEPEEIAMLEELAGDLGFAIASFRQRQEVARLTAERTANYEETIFSFVDMIEQRDTYTAGHTERVSYYSRRIAREMGLSAEESHRLMRAASLHDIGKIATPDAVLLKPGKLDALEHDLIKLHAVAGYEMLSNIEMYKDLAAIILHHHERFDGNGYPDRLKGEEIPLLARILSVADAFDAMTTNRVYKPRKELAAALEQLRKGSGGQFDPVVVAAALKTLDRVAAPEVLAAEPESDRFCSRHRALCGVTQTPVTEMERKRFSYFFNDRLTGLFNEDYLKAVVRNNQEDYTYKCLHVLHLQGIKVYNKQQGWEKGNLLLKYFADELKIQFPEDLLFRVYGNDFVVISREHQPLGAKELASFACLRGTRLQVVPHHLDLVRDGKYTIDKLEKIELRGAATGSPEPGRDLKGFIQAKEEGK